jgi:hypothetical protein
MDLGLVAPTPEAGQSHPNDWLWHDPAPAYMALGVCFFWAKPKEVAACAPVRIILGFDKGPLPLYSWVSNDL